jgi:CheY-like chemotaxis protein
MEGGLGIGLTLVRNLVELHGGEVRAVSEGVGRGSRFLVSLPILADEQTRTSMSEEAPAPESVPPSRVLVVEDNADSAEGVAALLRISGLEVEIAADGPSALKLCRDFRPDLVLLDIGLPGMDGYEVGRRLRQILGADARIVALTGYGHDEDRRRASRAGIDEHVLKPIRPEAIEALLRRAKRGD